MKKLFIFSLLMSFSIYNYAQITAEGNGDLTIQAGNNEPDIFFQNGLGVDLSSICISSDGEFGIFTNTSRRMTVTDDGVGIGTSSPTTLFDVRGDLTIQEGSPGIFFRNTAGDLIGEVRSTGSVLEIESETDDIRFQTVNNTRMLIDQDGDIGIGTTSPSAKFDISHNSSQTDAHIELNETGANDYARIKFRTANSAAYWDVAGATGTTDRFNLFYYDGSTGNNFFSIDPINDNIQIDGDITPLGNVQFDLGNNTSTEHWDDCVADDFINFSDKRLKEDINDLENVLPSLLKLRPVTYKYLEKHNIDGRVRTGFIAQEMQDVFSNVVIDKDIDFNRQTNQKIVTQSEYLSMNYIELIPIAIKAIQEQQLLIEKLEAVNQSVNTENENLQNEVKQLKAKVDELYTLAERMAALENNLQSCCLQHHSSDSHETGTADIFNADQPQLQQNFPNPFNEQTEIQYYLSTNVSTAHLHITDLTGKTLQSFDLTTKGIGKVMLNGGQLPAGTYVYTLVIDGVVIDTKQMVLTK